MKSLIPTKVSSSAKGSLVFGHPSSPSASADRLLDVLVVDDSIVVRGFLTRWLGDAEGVGGIRTANHGGEAVAAVQAAPPDVVLLDIEMPHMTGIEALPLIRRYSPRSVVIVSSSLTPHGAALSLRCLELGATEIIPKPSIDGSLSTLPSYRRDIIETVQTLGFASLRHSVHDAAAAKTAKRVPSGGEADRTLRSRLPSLHADGPAARAAPLSPAAAPLRQSPKAIVIGASTGGPQALVKLLGGLQKVNASIPIVIAQHMPAVFTTILAEHLSSATGLVVAEAVDQEPLAAGRVYLAPGGSHLRIRRSGALATLQVHYGPPVRFARPSVDVLFQSAAEVFGGALMGVVLTGMGSDGTDGARAIMQVGGTVLAQDEATSVVWGMPGAVVKAGASSEVLPIDAIAAAASAAVTGERS